MGRLLGRALGAALAGLALSAAYEPLAQAWLLPVAVASYALLLRGVSMRSGAGLGAVFGLMFLGTHWWWMSAVGWGAWAALTLASLAICAVQGAVVASCHRAPWWPLTVALTWSAVEWTRSGWPVGGMPWGRLAYATAGTPAAPMLAYAGAIGTGFGLALLGTSLAWAAATYRPGARTSRTARALDLRPAVLLGALLALFALTAVHPWRAQPVGGLTVAVVQGGVPGAGDTLPAHLRQVTRRQVSETLRLASAVRDGRAARPDLVVWPESSTAVDPFEDGRVDAAVEEAARGIGAPILVGAMVDVDLGQVANQGIAWDPATGPGDRYTKRHPVPFGEYLPAGGDRLLGSSNLGDLRVPRRDAVAGTRGTPLAVAGTLVADAICFDVAYDDVLAPQVRHGARVAAVQTSNATFVRTHQLEQQFAISRLQAIQTGRWVVVAAVNGISGVVAPDGSVVARLGKQRAGFLEQEIGLVDGLTPAVRLGPWPGRVIALAWAMCLVLLGFSRLRGKMDVQHQGRRSEKSLT